MSMSIDLSGVEKLNSVLGNMKENTARRVINRGLNRGLTAMGTMASRKIRSVYTVDSATVKRAMEKKQSSVSSLKATLSAKGMPISILHFKGTRERKPKGVFVTIKKGSRKNLPHSFFWGTRGSFHRVGTSRLPIKREYGPSVPGMLKNTTITGEVMNRGVEMYQKTVEHEIIRRLLGVGGGL